MFEAKDDLEPKRVKSFLLGELPMGIRKETVGFADVEFEVPSTDDVMKKAREIGIRIQNSSGSLEEGVRWMERLANLASKTIATKVHLVRAEMYHNAARVNWAKESVEAAKASHETVKVLANLIDERWRELTNGRPVLKKPTAGSPKRS